MIEPFGIAHRGVFFCGAYYADAAVFGKTYRYIFMVRELSANVLKILGTF